MSEQPYINQASRDEHDHSQVPTKKVLLYGWNVESLTKVRLAVNTRGEIVTDDPLSSYQIANRDTASDPMYIGYVDSDGNWLINKIEDSLGIHTWAEGTTDFTTNWSNRATSLSYVRWDLL